MHNRQQKVPHLKRFVKIIGSSKFLKKFFFQNRVIPVNYVHLAFSYFDKGHCGSMPTDDLIAVLNSVGYFLSKKVLSSLVGSLPDSNVDRVNYREFQEPPMLLERKFHYPTISLKQQVPILEVDGDQNLLENTTGPLIVERNSNQYNIDELIKQSEIDHKTKVRLNEQLSISNNKIGLLIVENLLKIIFIQIILICLIGQMSQVITELEARQKKMSAATGRQNDELCSVKRERDQLKSKVKMQIMPLISQTKLPFLPCSMNNCANQWKKPFQHLRIY